MRKLIASHLMSIDGFVAVDDNSTTDLPTSPDAVAFQSHNVARLRETTTVITGRASYEVLQGYWPPVEHDASASELQHEVSRLLNSTEHVVISDSLRVSVESPWADATTVVSRSDAVDAVVRLKSAGTGDITVVGSPTTWNSLMAAGLVDELHILVAPVLLGSGVPALRTGLSDQLSLLETRTLSEFGHVGLRYGVNRESGR